MRRLRGVIMVRAISHCSVPLALLLAACTLTPGSNPTPASTTGATPESAVLRQLVAQSNGSTNRRICVGVTRGARRSDLPASALNELRETAPPVTNQSACGNRRGTTPDITLMVQAAPPKPAPGQSIHLDAWRTGVGRGQDEWSCTVTPVGSRWRASCTQTVRS